MAVWLFLHGQEAPERGWSDANGNLIDAEAKQINEEDGSENIDYSKKIDLSKVREVKIRNGWNGFSDEKHYGKIEIKTLKE